MIRHLLVGVDGSAASSAAMAWAAELAHELSSRVTVVHAAGLVERARADAADERTFEDELRHQLLHNTCGPLRHRGVLHEVVVRPGPPAQILLELAREGADLVVVGRRGMATPGAMQLGSTSHQLLNESPVPVVVIGAASSSSKPSA
jgi:nucleotide-binding universal stress UspA family protein